MVFFFDGLHLNAALRQLRLIQRDLFCKNFRAEPIPVLPLPGTPIAIAARILNSRPVVQLRADELPQVFLGHGVELPSVNNARLEALVVDAL